MSDRREKVLRPFEEQRDYMNERIATGIEANRKGPMTLKFTDKNGRPVTGAHVELRQTSHDFRYGANLFMLDEFNEAEQNVMYKEYFKGAFNLATLPFYWKDLEPEKGKPRYAADSPRIYRRPAPDLCVDFCLKHGIEPKAHCIAYDQWKPDWLTGSAEECRAEYVRRMSELSARYAASIPSWEVTNETLFQAGNGHSALFREPDYVEWCFKTADQFFPHNRLVINDAHCNIWNVFNYSHSAYYMQIENQLLKGSRIDSIGMQYHMFYRAEDEADKTAIFYDPRRMYDVMDFYGRLGRPLQITELTIPAYSYGAEDEDIQAEIIKNIYSMWFSHQSMEAIIYWNVVDGFAAFAPQGDMAAGENYYHGGLVRYDFTPKPAYRMIQNLFGKVWRSNMEIDCGGADSVSFRGFFGDYDAVVTVNERVFTQKFHLGKGGAEEVTVVVPE